MMETLKDINEFVWIGLEGIYVNNDSVRYFSEKKLRASAIEDITQFRASKDAVKTDDPDALSDILIYNAKIDYVKEKFNITGEELK